MSIHHFYPLSVGKRDFSRDRIRSSIRRQVFWGAQKTLKLVVNFFEMLKLHAWQHGDVHVIF